MRKTALKLLVAALVFAMLATPITASAAWDLVFFNDDEVVQESPTSTTYPFKNIKSKIKSAKENNADAVAWLKIPNTNIDFPIVFNPKQNNNYYVNRDINGKNYTNLSWSNWSSYPDTATYLDYRSKLGSSWKSGTSKNLVLYGHNWNNLRAPFAIGNVSGYSMFGQLPSYTNIDFAKANPHIYFSTEDYEGIWRVFSVAYCEISTDFYYNNPNPSTENYQKLLNEWKSRSLFNFDVDVSTSDRIITLSTCTRVYGNRSEGGAGDYQRFVVVARLLRDGESESDKVTVSHNPSIKQPKFN